MPGSNDGDRDDDISNGLRMSMEELDGNRNKAS